MKGIERFGVRQLFREGSFLLSFGISVGTAVVLSAVTIGYIAQHKIALDPSGSKKYVETLLFQQDVVVALSQLSMKADNTGDAPLVFTGYVVSLDQICARRPETLMTGHGGRSPVLLKTKGRYTAGSARLNPGICSQIERLKKGQELFAISDEPTNIFWNRVNLIQARAE